MSRLAAGPLRLPAVALTRESRTAALASAALAALLALELLLVGLAAAHPSRGFVPASEFTFRTWLAGPLRGLFEDIAPYQGPTSRVVLAILAAMCVCYLALLRVVRDVGVRWVVLAVATAHAVILLAPPLRLSDVFNYLAFARLGAIHHLDPYTHGVAVLHHDPIVRFATWRHHSTPYGPLFTLATYPLAFLGIPAAVWTIKVATVAASAACAALVWRLATRLGRAAGPATLTFALNPVTLVYGLGGFHNDFLMMLLLLAGAYLALVARERAAGAALPLALGVKTAALPMLAFAWLAAPNRRRVIAAGAMSALVLVGVAVAVFGHRDAGLVEQAKQVTRYSVPAVVAAAVGHGPSDACLKSFMACHESGLHLATTAALIGSLAILAWSLRRGADWVTCAGWAGLALVVTVTSVQPWYLLWALPFAALSRSRALHVATGAVGAYLIVTSWPALYLIFGMPHYG